MRSSYRLLGLVLVVAIATIGLALLPGEAEAGGGIFVVNSTNDVDDGICDHIHCSLREAIFITNALGGPQEIQFDIPVSGVARIRLCRPLPIISDVGTRIDGTTQPGYIGSPLVILEPRYTPSDLILSTPWGPPPCVSTTVGLWIEADSTMVTGLSLVGFNSNLSGYTPAAIVINSGTSNTLQDNFLGMEPNGTIRPNRRGIMIGSSGQIVRGNVISGNDIGVYVSAPSQTIQGNRIGTDPTGKYSPGIATNGVGIYLTTAASDVLIGGSMPGNGNVISGSAQYGIYAQSNSNVIQGNIVGANIDGDTAIHNLMGITLDGRFNLIGGTGPSEGNLISGNHTRGIQLLDTDNTVQGNRIGVTLAGGNALTNHDGIEIQGADNQIGGGSPGEGNVISGNGGVGVWVTSPDNRIQGNLIGTDPSGTSAIPNGIGILINGTNNLVGGSLAGQGNVLSGNREAGLYINTGSGNSVLGNAIGTDHSGTIAIPNGAGIRSMPGDNIIGAMGMGNVVAYNSYTGIEVRGQDSLVRYNEVHDNGERGILVASGPSDIRNTVRRNETYANGLLGIDLSGSFGVTPNDAGDSDTGPNTLLNFPVLGTMSGGMVHGTACLNCIVDVFLSDGDPSGYGEGRYHLGQGLTDSSGNFQVDISASLPPPIAPCTRLTATATDSFGNTSEFSANARYGWCWVIDLPIWVATFVFPWFAGSLGGWLAGRRRPRPFRPLAVGSGIGAVVGGLLALGAFVLPNVDIQLPEGEPQEMSAPDVQPLCSEYFDPQGYSPPDGAVFETYEDPLLQWALLETAPESLGPFQVELLGPYGMHMDEVAEAMSLPFSTFGLLPEPGSLYAWRVVPVEIDDAGRPEGQCQPGRWMTFQMGQAEDPGDPPWIPEYVPEPLPEEPTEPELTCEDVTVVITALQDLNCREGTSQAFEIRGTLFQAAQASVLAFNPLKTWAFIENPSSPGSFCWVWMGQAEITEGDPTCAPIRRDPEPPAPAPACTRELLRDQCADAGGTWIESAAAAYCSCPTP
jgi:CSLREA domain-containing protein